MNYGRYVEQPTRGLIVNYIYESLVTLLGGDGKITTKQPTVPPATTKQGTTAPVKETTPAKTAEPQTTATSTAAPKTTGKQTTQAPTTEAPTTQPPTRTPPSDKNTLECNVAIVGGGKNFYIEWI